MNNEFSPTVIRAAVADTINRIDGGSFNPGSQLIRRDTRTSAVMKQPAPGQVKAWKPQPLNSQGKSWGQNLGEGLAIGVMIWAVCGLAWLCQRG